MWNECNQTLNKMGSQVTFTMPYTSYCEGQSPPLTSFQKNGCACNNVFDIDKNRLS